MSEGLSLPTVSARIDGDVSSMVSQFKRAENQAGLTSAKIDAEVADLTRRINRRFSLGHLGTDLADEFDWVLRHALYFQKVAGVEGLEPPALGFGDRCSTN